MNTTKETHPDNSEPNICTIEASLTAEEWHRLSAHRQVKGLTADHDHPDYGAIMLRGKRRAQSDRLDVGALPYPIPCCDDDCTRTPTLTAGDIPEGGASTLLDVEMGTLHGEGWEAFWPGNETVIEPGRPLWLCPEHGLFPVVVPCAGCGASMRITYAEGLAAPNSLPGNLHWMVDAVVRERGGTGAKGYWRCPACTDA